MNRVGISTYINDEYLVFMRIAKAMREISRSARLSVLESSRTILGTRTAAIGNVRLQVIVKHSRLFDLH